jgi:phosphoribosylaminoimidazole-succinocarboxamide synthase
MPLPASVSPALLLSEGKTKQLFSETPERLRVVFKDQATAFNAGKVATIEGKGALNASISAWLFAYLEALALNTCFIEAGETPTELIYKPLTMFKLEVVVRNVAYGSLCKRFPQFAQGEVLKQPLVEFFLKDDAAGDPALSETLIEAMALLPASVNPELLKRKALQVNEALLPLFASLNIICADFKLEFGLDAKHQLCLADELSPDSFRLRDSQTGQVLDKDVFRLDLGDLKAAYQTVFERLQQEQPEAAAKTTRSTLNKQAALPQYKAKLTVQYRPNVLHPESRSILQAIHNLNFNTVETLVQAKQFNITMRAPSLRQAEEELAAMADKLLANPVIEAFTIEHLAPLV